MGRADATGLLGRTARLDGLHSSLPTLAQGVELACAL